jgi:UDP-N-acetylglucosamine--N-acetylmuramyl-(pentapeptide) pyrophosphoryl-undecaprenol N-acetylglucosamine transferase
VSTVSKPLVAIACGGTGGHLFPGLAVADQLMIRGCDVLALVSPKEVDQHSVKNAMGVRVATLPAVGLTGRNYAAFLSGFWKSYRASRRVFRDRPPQAVLAMGGFTSAPPVLAGRACGAATFLHESNTIPGKANRWLAHFVDQAFVGFSEAAGRLHHHNILRTGTPVRPQFQPASASACRVALGLAETRPLLLIMGGSQGASGINDLALEAAPILLQSLPSLQFLHLTGPQDVEKVRLGYEKLGAKALVRPFLSEMELALAAADAAVSRAGASSMAELAAMRLPAVLIPFPAAADDHQFYNAQAYVQAGAAVSVDQKKTNGAALASRLLPLLTEPGQRAAMQAALGGFHHGHAAELIAERMFAFMEARRRRRPDAAASESPKGTNHRRLLLQDDSVAYRSSSGAA